MAWLQLSLGVSSPVLEHTSKELPHMEALWVGSMRQSLASTKTIIQLDQSYIPPRQRENDVYVMDLILESNHYTPNEIRTLNYCRLSADIVTVSDLTLPCGTQMDMEKLLGIPSEFSSWSHHHPINQERPSDAEWKIWSRASLLWSDINGKLRQPLGKWLLPLSAQRQRHFAFVHLDHLWVNNSGTERYREYRRYEFDEGFHSLLRSTVSFESIPYGGVPISVKRLSSADVWRTREPPISHFAYRKPAPASVTSFSDLVTTFEPWEFELLQ